MCVRCPWTRLRVRITPNYSVSQAYTHLCTRPAFVVLYLNVNWPNLARSRATRINSFHKSRTYLIFASTYVYFIKTSNVQYTELISVYAWSCWTCQLKLNIFQPTTFNFKYQSNRQDSCYFLWHIKWIINGIECFTCS